jgi:hypothetical protein
MGRIDAKLKIFVVVSIFCVVVMVMLLNFNKNKVVMGSKSFSTEQKNTIIIQEKALRDSLVNPSSSPVFTNDSSN